MPSEPDSFRPAARLANLRLRAGLLRQLRQFFDARGFIEVETPLLSADVVVDRHLDPIRVVLPDDPREPHLGREMWLQTSPEAAMKRLLVAGAEAIYQVTRSFRAGERGKLHNPEFTIVEWYRAGDELAGGMQLLDELCQVMLGRGPATMTTYAEAFARHVGVEPHTADVEQFKHAARTHQVAVPPMFEAADRDDWLNLLLATCIEPNLGRESPELLYLYPASQAALAKIREGTPPVAERFELYVEGVELANGFHELTDANELRRRTATENAARTRDGKPELPIPRQLLAAMDHGLPSATGVALGFDRLVMLAAGATSVDDAMAFPIERA